MNKECAACGWDGTLTRLTCPGCGEEKWYCSDCHVGKRAFNCEECQVHSNSAGEVNKKCIRCKQSVPMNYGPMSVDIMCGECNEVFEGTFNGHHPTFYGVYTADLAYAAAHESVCHDSQVVDFFNPKDFAVVRWGDVMCECPRDERRWGTEQHKHDPENPEDDDF